MNYKEIAQETLNIEAQTLLKASQNITDVLIKLLILSLSVKVN
jgi:hypothetical protein